MTNPTTTLPTWDDMSDLDKGAALMHLHKRNWEGISYAVDNYPARYFDHPALTSLNRREACQHAASMRGQADKLADQEYERLYELARNEPERRCLWAARNSFGRPACPTYAEDARAAAIELLTVIWPKYQSDADRSLWALLTRDEPGGEWREVPFDVSHAAGAVA